MKAIVIESYGGPEQLKLVDTKIPEPQDHEVQIQVEYAAINPVDWKIREGLLERMIPCRFPAILGWDVSGTITAVGKKVKQFKLGDAVFSYCRRPEVHSGTYAEYTCVEEDHIALKPENITFAQSSAVPLAALTAWQALHEAVKLKKGETILVHAGAGGVGSFAIQIAKLLGAHVYTTASSNHQLYVNQLGAEVAIDYHKKNFVQAIKELHPKGIDAVFDCIGGDTLKESYKVLKPKGRLVSIVERPNEADAKEHQVEALFVFVRPDGKQLKEIAELITKGKIQAPHIEEYRLEDAAKAQEKLQAGHTEGKIVLKVR